MRRRVWCALIVGSGLAACNAITSIGDYTFDGVDAGSESGSEAAANDASPRPNDATIAPDADAAASADADASADAGTTDADATTIDARTPDADASPCTIISPNTSQRELACGPTAATACDLNASGVSPPYHCCVAPDASAACINTGAGETCPKPSFDWVCTRAFQCPYPSPCCLTVDQITPTCPPTAHAVESKCLLDTDGGCNLDLELCTGNEECRKPGSKCMELDIVGTGARPLGVCL